MVISTGSKICKLNIIVVVVGIPEPSYLHELESQLSSPISIFWNTISYSPILKYKLQYRKMQVCHHLRYGRVVGIVDEFVSISPID